MKKDASTRQEQTQSPDEVQGLRERPQSPQPMFEPEQAQPEIGNEDIAQRAYAIYEARGRFPGAELDDWLQAEQELRNQDRSEADKAA